MTKKDKIFLAHFTTRTSMWVIDENNFHSVVNFINGYESGRNGNFKFTELSKSYIRSKYKVESSSDGWNGQIERLSKKLFLSPSITFKKIALEILFANNPDKGVLKSIKIVIENRIDQIEFSQSKEYEMNTWLPFLSIKLDYQNQLWKNEQLKVVESIMKEMQEYLIENKINRVRQNRLKELKIIFNTLKK